MPIFPLRTHFRPGDRFSYSGEGYLYLQRAIEAITGETLEELAHRLVFEPLGMARSSFVWQRRFEQNRAYPHDEFGRPARSYQASGAECRGEPANDGGRLCALPASRSVGRSIEARDSRAVAAASCRRSTMPALRRWGRTSRPFGRASPGGWAGASNRTAGTFFHWGDNNTLQGVRPGLDAGALGHHCLHEQRCRVCRSCLDRSSPPSCPGSVPP